MATQLQRSTTSASTRRFAGEGSIRERPDGRFEIRFRVGGKRISRFAHDRAGALAILQELQGQARTGTLAPPTTITLGAWLDEWLSQHGTTLRASTRDSYARVLAHGAALNAVKLSRLEPRHILALYAERRQAGVSAFRLERLHRILHKALGDAMRLGIVGRNVAAAAPCPRPVPRERALWSLAQVRQFLAACHEATRDGSFPPSVQAGLASNARLFAFLALSGLRCGEAAALTWEAVDLEAGVIRVERSVSKVAGVPVEGAPKSRAGSRTFALPAEAVALLHEQRVAHAERRLAAGGAWPGGERVFVNVRGAVPDRAALRRSLQRLCARAGVPVIRVHDLRHLHATLLVAGGVSVKEAQRRLGHSSVRLTLDVYARAVPEADALAADAVSRLVS